MLKRFKFRFKFSVLALLLVAMLPFSSSVSAEEESISDAERYSKQKVVYHINFKGGEGGRRYRAAMGNIRNHIQAVGEENIEVKVVLHGDGVDMLMHAKENDELQSRIVYLKNANVQMQVCNRTLTGHDVSYEEDLFGVSEGDIVPSGVAEISRLQQMGYTYVKP